MDANGKQITSLKWLVAALASVLIAGAAYSANSPLLYLGLYDIDNMSGTFAMYDNQTDNLSAIKAQFPQFGFVRMASDGSLYGSLGNMIYRINPETGEATPELALNNTYYDFECGGFWIDPYNVILVHEYTNRITGAWQHLLWQFVYWQGAWVPYPYPSEPLEITGVNGMYGFELVNDLLYAGNENGIQAVDWLNTGQVTPVVSGIRAWELDRGPDGVLRVAVPGPGGGVCLINSTDNTSTLVKDFSIDHKEVWSVNGDRFAINSISQQIIWPNMPGYLFINGSGFRSGMTAKLVKNGQADVHPVWMNFYGAFEIRGVFNFTGASFGYWDLVLTNPDGTSVIWNGAIYYTIPQPTAQVVRVSGTTFDVSWSAVSGAADYLVECAETDSFTSIVADSDWVTGTSYRFSGLSERPAFCFRVIARTPPQAGVWSQPAGASFDTDWRGGASLLTDPVSVVLAGDEQSGYGSSGQVYSTPIIISGGPWGTLTYTGTTPPDTSLTVDVGSPYEPLISNASSGTDLSGLEDPILVLRAALGTNNSSVTPALTGWSVSYTENFYSAPSATVYQGSLSYTHSLTVHVVIPGYTGLITGIPISLECRWPDHTPISQVIYLDASGNYTLTDLPSGVTYTVSLQTPGHCQETQMILLDHDATLEFVLGLPLLGDADVDGVVAFADFSTLQSNYGQTGKTWAQGDFNGDGQVTFEDFAALQNHYGERGSQSSLQMSSPSQNQVVASAQLAVSPVPEPTAIPTPTAWPTPTREPTPTLVPTCTPTPTPDPIPPVLITLSSVKTDDTHFEIRAEVPGGAYTLCCVAVSIPVTQGLTITSELTPPEGPEDDPTDAFALRRVLFGTTDEGGFAGGVEAVDNGTARFAEIFVYRRIRQLRWTDGVLEGLRTPAAGGEWQTIDNATTQGTSVVVVEGTVPSGTPAPELAIGNYREPMVPGEIYTDITSGWTCGKTYRTEGTRYVAPANITLSAEP